MEGAGTGNTGSSGAPTSHRERPASAHVTHPASKPMVILTSHRSDAKWRLAAKRGDHPFSAVEAHPPVVGAASRPAPHGQEQFRTTRTTFDGPVRRTTGTIAALCSLLLVSACTEEQGRDDGGAVTAAGEVSVFDRRAVHVTGAQPEACSSGRISCGVGLERSLEMERRRAACWSTSVRTSSPRSV